jgi:TolB-like protein
MAEKLVQRRLAAIRATGVVGYSRLMEQEGRQWALESSIAVLSFTNFSGDAEQYFSDGVTEDIIRELSRFRQSFMVARNSPLKFRRPTVNLADDRPGFGAVRIAAQLIGVRSA